MSHSLEIKKTIESVDWVLNTTESAEEFCDYFDKTIDELKGKLSLKHISRTRNALAFFFRDGLKLSKTEIATYFNRGSMHHNIKGILQTIDQDDNYALQVQYVVNRLVKRNAAKMQKMQEEIDGS